MFDKAGVEEMLRTEMKIGNLIVGAATLAEWFGESQETVKPEVAEWRASVCAGCPLNERGGWRERWGEYCYTLAGIRNWLRERGCQTVRDAQLHVCSACDCPNKIKIWCPKEIILNHMNPKTIAKLHVHCWMRKP